MLEKLNLKYVGPAPEFNIDFAPRLNVFTGDNGLGKSFLLEVAWRALTQTWINAPALPQKVRGEVPEINYHISNYDQPFTSKFKWQNYQWSKLKGNQQPIAGLVIYIGINQQFSVWDPARNYYDFAEENTDIPPSAYHFTSEQIWNGLKVNDGKSLCNGLIDDWVKWYDRKTIENNFNQLSNIIKILAPHQEDSWMKPGKPMRVNVNDVREIPTLILPYETIPVTEVSAGMKRILGIAYILIWSWLEHIEASELKNQETTNQIILLIDEVELHLHPQWQRAILPAILEVVKSLKEEIDIQILATTHSPLVLASLEPDFDESQDQLFLLDLEENNVTLKDIPFAKFGDINRWLSSDLFGLENPRSRQAEIVIKAAYDLMNPNKNMDNFPENLRTKEGIEKQFKKVLSADDRLWRIWEDYWEN